MTEKLITDHAVNRYIQRIYCIDIDSIKREILDGREALVKAMKKGRVLTSKYILVVRDGVVVTVLDKE